SIPVGVLWWISEPDVDDNVHGRGQQYLRSIHKDIELRDRPRCESAGGDIGDAVAWELWRSSGLADQRGVLLIAVVWTGGGRVAEREKRVCTRSREPEQRETGDELCDIESEPDRCVVQLWIGECREELPDLRIRAEWHEPESDDGGQWMSGESARDPGNIH